MYACIYVALNICVKMPKRLGAAISQNAKYEIYEIFCFDYDGVFLSGLRRGRLQESQIRRETKGGKNVIFNMQRKCMHI